MNIKLITQVFTVCWFFGLHGRQELCENGKDEEYKLNYSNFSSALFVKGKIYIMYSVNGRYVQTS